MKNQEIAKIFYDIATYLEMENVAFKPQAYERAALSLETLAEDVEDIYKKEGFDGLRKISGVGESIAEKIEEYLKTGKIKYYESFRKKMPVNIEELTSVEGIGPKMVSVLYKYLKIKNLEDLEKAALAGKIRKLPNFGEKTERNILQGIEFLKRSKGRFLLGYILPEVKEIIEKLKSLKEVKEISPAGSVRRMKETIGDVDILVIASNPNKVVDYFISLPGIVKIWGKGPTKASVRMQRGFDVDIRVIPEGDYGSALQYFTGSKEHNIATRKIAMEKGLKLNEYGIFRGKKKLASRTEGDVYKIIGLPYIEPELRENTGEIEAALRSAQGKLPGLPKLIAYTDIKGDLHCHSKWDGGANSIGEMAGAAIEMGYEYIGISDHTKFLRIEHGLDEKELLAQRKEIEKINLKFKTQHQSEARCWTSPAPSRPFGKGRDWCGVSNCKFKILQGCEANILNDGSIDIKDEALGKLDYVIAGVHSQMKMPRDKMTERIIRAMENPNVDIISHPTGRLLKRRDEYQIDFDKILETAKKTGTILEINSYPDRLDLNDQNIKKAVRAGVKLVINTDSHDKSQMRYMELGVAQARRGWAEKKDIINTQPLERLLKLLK